MNTVETQKNNALMMACAIGHVDLALELLKIKAWGSEELTETYKPGIPCALKGKKREDTQTLTPLMMLCSFDARQESGNTLTGNVSLLNAVIQGFMDRGVSGLEAHEKGWTALSLAMESGHEKTLEVWKNNPQVWNTEVCKTLKINAADYSLQHYGIGSSDWIDRNKPEYMKAVSTEVYRNIKTRSKNMLEYAVERGWVRWVDALLSLGLSPNEPNECGMCPWGFVKDSATLECLLKHGADPFLKDGLGISMLQYFQGVEGALEKNRMVGLVTQSLKKAPVAVAGKKGVKTKEAKALEQEKLLELQELNREALHTALKKDNKSNFCKLVTSLKFDVNQEKGLQGESLLQEAMWNGKWSVVEWLQEKGAQEEAGNRWGMATMIYALMGKEGSSNSLKRMEWLTRSGRKVLADILMMGQKKDQILEYEGVSSKKITLSVMEQAMCLAFVEGQTSYRGAYANKVESVLRDWSSALKTLEKNKTEDMIEVKKEVEERCVAAGVPDIWRKSVWMSDQAGLPSSSYYNKSNPAQMEKHSAWMRQVEGKAKNRSYIELWSEMGLIQAIASNKESLDVVLERWAMWIMEWDKECKEQEAGLSKRTPQQCWELDRLALKGWFDLIRSCPKAEAMKTFAESYMHRGAYQTAMKRMEEALGRGEGNDWKPLVDQWMGLDAGVRKTIQDVQPKWVAILEEQMLKDALAQQSSQSSKELNQDVKGASGAKRL